MKAVCLLLALSTASVQEPATQTPAVKEAATPEANQPSLRKVIEVQARNVRARIGKGRAVSAFLPKDRDGNRFYYSRNTMGRYGYPGFSESTIYSWSDPTGRPIRARYFVDTGDRVREYRMEVGESAIAFEEVTTNQTSGRWKSAQLMIRFLPGTSLQLSQFHPMDITLNDKGVADFTMVDPIAKRASKARVIRKEDKLVDVGLTRPDRYKRYRIEVVDGWTEIELTEGGSFRSMVDSQGNKMVSDELREEELLEVSKVLGEARG